MLAHLVPNASASWAPLQDVQASKSYDAANRFYVNYRVYEPARGSWMEGAWQANQTVPSLTNEAGVVAWRSYDAANRFYVNYRVYEPARGSWMEGTWQEDQTVPSLTNQAGVVAWQSYDAANRNYVNYRVYDPSRGSWAEGGWQANQTVPTVKNETGVVAWQSYDAANRNYVDYRVYDPARGSWMEGTWAGSQLPTNLAVANATVTWTAGGTSYTRGYDPGSGSWYDGPTKPLAYFSPSATSGNPPLFVWFTDTSIGGTSWSWDFGDGSGSSLRSPSHTYTSAGVYTVTETVTGPGGSYSKSITIVTDSQAPVGSINIENGAAYTRSTSVTLGLSATDNSGSVSSMRFSNDGSNWSGWEAYSTSKTWTLPSGDGVKTVYAQFKDAAGNQSSSATDSITLDTSAPVDGNLTATAGNGQVSLSWSGFSDATSGIKLL